MSTTTEYSESPRTDSTLALPDPGERVPTLSWPIVGIFTLSLTVFAAATWAALNDHVPAVGTIAASGAAIFVMFTVLHDASHYSISSHRWVNVAFGRVAMLFVSPLISFSSFAFIHIAHHRNTNHDDGSDPDHFVTASPYWQLPLRFPIMDVPYLGFLLRNVRRRPRIEIVETAVSMTVTVAVIVAAGLSGNLWTLAVVYLIPSRVAMFVLAWWFDWLPHHDLDDTPRENRYRTTRNRMGSEWILTPLLLSQNYHLVHHLHPSIPFYRYVAAWRRNEDAYLERGAAIGTVLGQQLDAQEYREWQRINGKGAALLPVRRVSTSSGTPIGHPLAVRAVEQLTPDSVKVTFDVPDRLRDEFRFTAGQHITIHHTVDGQDVRRNYSICSTATSGELSIGIRRVAGGTFSTHAVEKLRSGDVLTVEPPAGTFGATTDPAVPHHHVAVAAGSGITPILSLVGTTLEVEPKSRFTLFYGNRSAELTMFASDLDDLATRYADRLRVVHIRSCQPDHPTPLCGRITTSVITRLLDEDLASMDRWYLCGPSELSTSVRSDLLSAGVPGDHIHLELFRGATRRAKADDALKSRVTVRLSGSVHELPTTRGDSVLEAALANRLDAPYSCLGGACGTCRAKLTSGSVSMDQNLALSKAEVEQGFVLTCQSHPTSSEVAVDYDSRPARATR